MAGRGLSDSFADGLARLVQEIARVELSMDVSDMDQAFLDQLRTVIRDYIKGRSTLPSGDGPNAPPISPDMTRGVTPGNPNMAAMSDQLAGMMAGAPQ